MLTNATILRIDRANGADAAGRTRWTAGSAIEVRCALDQISSQQRYTLGAVLQDADQVVFVERNRLTAANESAPTNGSRLTVLPDGSSTMQTLSIVTTNYALAPHSGALSHHELYVRRDQS
ncbi:MAG: hypothetical protein IT445_11435 [Phycisphaeraceae bacterium]|nr:hypothetical protein [Phycisphaeraceae bacterium]